MFGDDTIEIVLKYYTRNGQAMKYVRLETPTGLAIGQRNPFNVLTDTEIDQTTYDNMVLAKDADEENKRQAADNAKLVFMTNRAAAKVAAKAKLIALGLTEEEINSLSL